MSAETSREERSNWPALLRLAIQQSGRAPGSIADAAGIQRSQLARFMQGAGISLDTAGLIAAKLGLSIVADEAKPARKNSK